MLMEKKIFIISIHAVRKVLSDMGLTQVIHLTDEEIGRASLLFDLGLEDHEIPEFLERIEKLKDVYLDKEAIINFLHNGYTTNVFDLRDFSSKHFSTTRPM